MLYPVVVPQLHINLTAKEHADLMKLKVKTGRTLKHIVVSAIKREVEQAKERSA